MMDELENKLDDLKSDMKENNVSEKKKAPAKKKVPAKKAAAPAAKKTKDENTVSLKDLSAKLKIDPRDARKKLRKAGLKAEGRWAWPAGSADLKKVEEALKAE